ncbi:hypothetical protein CYMTET_42260 [Cymbomonas tetramitiformis]|uniref:Uncharacterized protein n=1 Tax=Cymbomonas tetramitiformis TaxID=36881 RepID=A0AAE0C666_9CHLO|nr:hypothetical protein CYMTET_42260 [Cymbomonas tetramitiformis]
MARTDSAANVFPPVPPQRAHLHKLHDSSINCLRFPTKTDAGSEYTCSLDKQRNLEASSKLGHSSEAPVKRAFALRPGDENCGDNCEVATSSGWFGVEQPSGQSQPQSRGREERGAPRAGREEGKRGRKMYSSRSRGDKCALQTQSVHSRASSHSISSLSRARRISTSSTCSNSSEAAEVSGGAHSKESQKVVVSGRSFRRSRSEFAAPQEPPRLPSCFHSAEGLTARCAKTRNVSSRGSASPKESAALPTSESSRLRGGREAESAGGEWLLGLLDGNWDAAECGHLDGWGNSADPGGGWGFAMDTEGCAQPAGEVAAGGKAEEVACRNLGYLEKDFDGFDDTWTPEWSGDSTVIAKRPAARAASASLSFVSCQRQTQHIGDGRQADHEASSLTFIPKVQMDRAEQDAQRDIDGFSRLQIVSARMRSAGCALKNGVVRFCHLALAACMQWSPLLIPLPLSPLLIASRPCLSSNPFSPKCSERKMQSNLPFAFFRWACAPWVGHKLRGLYLGSVIGAQGRDYLYCLLDSNTDLVCLCALLEGQGLVPSTVCAIP